MQTLYIVGNGFDIEHGLNTSYWNFREYLEKTYPEFLQEFEWLYDIESIDFTDPRVSPNAYERWQSAVYNKLWSEFENKIGQPNIDAMLDCSESILDDMNLEGGLVGITDTMDWYWREQYGYIRKFEQYVKEWIETINTERIRPRRKDLINSADYFLNFNYTDLLENIYKIDDVLHVHGAVDSVAINEPIMGHCNYRDIENHMEWAMEAEERFDEGEASIHRAVANYLKSIYKDTKSIIQSHWFFWEKLKSVDKVVIIGWSAGSADWSYLDKIRESVSKNTKWHVYYFDCAAYNALQQAMDTTGISKKFEVDYIPSSEFWDMESNRISEG